MKIRSITYFCDPHWPDYEPVIQGAGEFLQKASSAFGSAGYEVQTTRLATIPFPHILPEDSTAKIVSMAQLLEKAAEKAGINYLSLGPALPDHPWSYAVIPAIIAETKQTFMSGMMTEQPTGLSLPAIKACAQIIRRLADQSETGLNNMRFGALANVAPQCPFFPAAYHNGGSATFALAMEAADLAVEAFRSASSIEDGRRSLVSSIEQHAAALGELSQVLSEETRVPFAGFDFTMAPFPERDRSFGFAMELLGLPAVGNHGSLAAAALLVDTLDWAQYPRTGFNGLFLPVLEDAVLAQRASEGILSVKDLLMYAAVCGTGLDCVPLPGDISSGALEAILLDVSALSQRLKKQLLCRLLPVPGKGVGEPVSMDFSYFAASKVMDAHAYPLHGLLHGDEVIPMRPRRI